MTVLPTAAAFQAEPMSAQALSDALVQQRDYLAALLGTTDSPADALATLGALVSGHVAASSARSVAAADRGRVIAATGTWSLTLGAAATLGAGFACVVVNSGSGTITLTRSGSDQIDGATTAALAAGRAALVVSTGTAWITMAMPTTAAAALGLAHGGTGATTAAAARTNLGLGTAAPATLTTSASDATAGRVTQVGDFGLGGNAVQLSGSDSLASRNLQTGTYSYQSANITDGPEGSASWVRTVRVELLPATLVGGGNARRLWWDSRSSGTGTQRLWFGSNQNNDAIVWREVFHQGTLLGTVSQTGGVPTGAVIERGSNANGSFVRFADGTQICTRYVTIDALTATTAVGTLFVTGTASYSLPAAFVGGAPDFACAQLIGSNALSVRNNYVSSLIRRSSTVIATPDWTNVSHMFATSVSASVGELTGVRLFAIGRWF
jgi:hypothetical protein